MFKPYLKAYLAKTFLATAILSLIFAATLTAPISTAAASESEAAGHQEDHPVNPLYAPDFPKHPATRYSGNTPIDLGHGVLGTNGTYGLLNLAYEQQSKGPFVVPGLLVSPYPYNQKQSFVTAYSSALEFYEAAIVNLGYTSEITRPEVVTWAKELLPRLESLLKEAKASLSSAKSASSSDWAQAEQQARGALNALLGTYAGATNASLATH